MRHYCRTMKIRVRVPEDRRREIRRVNYPEEPREKNINIQRGADK